MELTILSKKQIEILEILKRSVLLNNLSVASVEDISAMKVISIIQRGLKKDFVDLWVIIRQTEYSLKDIFSFCKEKYGSAFSESIALKALTYFQDAEEEETPEGSISLLNLLKTINYKLKTIFLPCILHFFNLGFFINCKL